MEDVLYSFSSQILKSVSTKKRKASSYRHTPNLKASQEPQQKIFTESSSESPNINVTKLRAIVW